MRYFLFITAFLTGCCSPICNPRIYIDVPAEWSVCHNEFTEESPRCFNWWEPLEDPILTEMIESLSAKNLDLLIKAEEIYSRCGIKSIQRQEYRMLWNQKAFDTAKTYVELRLFQERLSLLEARIDSLQDSSALTRDLFDVGFANSIENIGEKERFALLKAERAEIELGEQKAINHLSVLQAGHPGDLFCRLSEKMPLPTLPKCLPIGFPCESILQRPDVLIMEIAVKKGVKPIRAYNQGVLLALEETENALGAFKYSRDNAKQLLIAMQESYKVYLETEEQYSKGLKNYLDVLTTKRTYLMSHEAYLHAESALIIAYLKLYEVLGVF